MKNSDMNAITGPAKPWVFRYLGSYDELVSNLESCVSSSIQLIELDAACMGTAESFYTEVAKKMKLPEYFGRNLNAFDECVNDLDWIDCELPVAVLVRDAEQLVHGDQVILKAFLDVMRNAGEEWSHPIESGNSWDRPAVPFHTIFHTGCNETLSAEFESLPVFELNET